MSHAERRNLAKAVLRKMGINNTDGQESAVMSIIGAMELLGVIDTARAVDIGSHGPIGVHIREGD